MRRSLAFRIKKARFALRRVRSDFERASSSCYLLFGTYGLRTRQEGLGYLPDYHLLAPTRLVRSDSDILIHHTCGRYALSDNAKTPLISYVLIANSFFAQASFKWVG
jgi:hypothetical protein